MRRTSWVLMSALALSLVSTGCGKTSGSGHGSGASGGDPTRTRLLEARLAVIEAFKNFDAEYLDAGTRADVTSFLTAQAALLAEDVEQSPQGWVKGQGTCAKTGLTRNALVEFDIDYCSEQILGFGDAFKLIVHESVHHFGIADEEFPDLVAIAVDEADQMRLVQLGGELDPPIASNPKVDHGRRLCPEPHLYDLPSFGVPAQDPEPRCVYGRVEHIESVPFEIGSSTLTVIVGNEPVNPLLAENLTIEPYGPYEIRILAKAKDQPIAPTVMECEPLRLVVTLYPRCDEP